MYLSYFQEDGDPEYVSKLGKILNGMGTSLIECYQKLIKSETKESENCRLILQAIGAKVELGLSFLGHPYDEVSSSVFDFIRDYLHVSGKISSCSLYNSVNL